MKPSTTAERLQEAMNIRGLKQVDVLRLAEPYCRAYGVNQNGWFSVRLILSPAENQEVSKKRPKPRMK